MKLESTEKRIKEYQIILEKIAGREVPHEEATWRLRRFLDYLECIFERVLKEADEELGWSKSQREYEHIKRLTYKRY